MCFVKSSNVEAQVAQPEPEVVERHQADASLTKTTPSQNARGLKENIKTTPLGLVDDAQTEKKTLLGE